MSGSGTTGRARHVPLFEGVGSGEVVAGVQVGARKGDAREAIRMLLRDLAVMEMDGDGATSRGFLRGRFSDGARRPPWIEEP